MRLDFAVFFVIGLLAGSPQASACSCVGGPEDLNEALTTARDQAAAIFLGRVDRIEVDPDASDAFLTRPDRVTFAVLETYKGTVLPRQVVTTESDTAACGYPFTPGGRFLVYARADGLGELSTYLCSRTRSLEETDPVELAFLRKRARPVVLRREHVSCTACDLASLATTLVCAGGKACEPTSPQKVPAAVPTGQPFGSEPRVNASTVSALYGLTTDGRAFELVRQPPLLDAWCVARVERHWCERLSPLPTEPGTRPRLECVGPTPGGPVCDELTTRRSSWGPIETIPPGRCHLGRAENLTCELDRVPTPVKSGTRTEGPGLLCSPSFLEGYSCRWVPDVSQTPPETGPR